METAVHFGAGKIGRGFIAELLHDTGYRVVFVDVVDALVDLINKDHEYYLFQIENNYKEKKIDNIEALSSIKEPEKVIAEINQAKVVTTSVMATNLPKIAPVLAKGLKSRVGQGKEKVVVMACENAMHGTDILVKAMIDSGEITQAELDEVGVYPNTAVDRMVFDGEHNGHKGIDIGVNYELAIEKDKLVNPDDEPIKGAEYTSDLDRHLQRKIYMINCGHAISAYIGYANGKDIVQDVLNDPELVKEVRAAVMESAAALEKEYGFSHESLVDYCENMFIKRFGNPKTHDEGARVGREPIRKISYNDRIMGPANMCEKYGLDNSALLKGVAYALHFYNKDDAQAVELQNYIKENGVEAAVEKYVGLKPSDRMFKVIVDDYNAIKVNR
ncbi:mannitol-1-phosphate 5-dehydrogenase [Absicoccus porci]|jgi:mannitol-1-phosphate 5-dehydrogenase|uniref:mannitol-1-phosphate 5-dehydrogenase n=1 Tax=Absicoccus porci TaxID=2486576 RepID=UPI00240A8DD7|nr:mannitol-1-phosphate 5-dehydrogenase [Absicoccus porci]MDD6460590.1 mannitol-1-phosphate 5-dehydrogenase [Absicoccus porci]MEE1355575.1 mannitol-1-phosphate 5-dehydrogenase [Absicoccus porci]